MKSVAPVLRIAHLSPTYFSKNSVIGGGERYVNNLVNALTFAAHQQNVALRQSVLSIGSEDESYLDGKSQIKIFKNASPFNGNMDGFSDCIRPEIEEVDLVHIHQSLTFFGAMATATVGSLGIPIVSTDLGGGANELMLAGRGLELSSGVLSISKYAASLLGSNYTGLHRSVIGPVDIDCFCPGPGTRQNDLAICVSRILPHKGIDRIIRALPDDLRLLVVGQVYDAQYFGLLVELAAGKRVTFVHDADDAKLVDLYRTASVFLQGSTHLDIYGNVIHKPELMGLTTLEAMACGLPAIVSDAGSLPELVPDKRFGLSFSTEEELRQAFADFTSGRWPDPSSCDLARRYVVDNFSYPQVGSLILQFYHDAIASFREREAIA